MMASTASSAVTNPNEGKSKPGENKERRDIVKLLLTFAAFCLLSGNSNSSFLSCILSIVSILHLKEGTMWSVKNWKWMTLSIISFLSSLAAWSFNQGYEILDEEKAYTLKFLMWWMSKSIQTMWGLILSLFLYSAYQSNDFFTMKKETIENDDQKRK